VHIQTIFNAKFGGKNSQIHQTGRFYGSLTHVAAEINHKIKVFRYIQENRSDEN
jgi:hypothetical protein